MTETTPSKLTCRNYHQKCYNHLADSPWLQPECHSLPLPNLVSPRVPTHSKTAKTVDDVVTIAMAAAMWCFETVGSPTKAAAAARVGWNHSRGSIAQSIALYQLSLGDLVRRRMWFSIIKTRVRNRVRL